MHRHDDERLRHDHTELGELLDQLIATFETKDINQTHAITQTHATTQAHATTQTHAIAQTHATLDLFWARLAMHIRAEHLHLFPAILQAVSENRDTRQNDAPSAAEAESVIEQLREDHDFFMRQLAQAVAVIRDLLKSPNTTVHEQLQDVRNTITAVQQRLLKHNEIEENGLYAWTKTLLSETEQAELAVLIDKELQNMPPRFSTHN